MLKRSFVPGDEWLYYKLYCNPLNADIILINYLKPLLDSLKNEMRVKNSFFVRYEDPKYHIRLRIQFNTISEISNALIKISQRQRQSLGL